MRTNGSNLRRGALLPALLAVGGVLILSQAQSGCFPASLLEADQPQARVDDGALVVEVQAGSELSSEQMQSLLDGAGDRGLTFVFLNPVPGPAGATGPEGTSGSPLIGEVRMWSGTRDVLPVGWLPCEGDELARADFAELFAVIGTIYGPGDGANTFQLPDFRNRSPMGADGAAPDGAPLTSASGTPQARGGTAAHRLSVDELASHAHLVSPSQEVVGTISSPTALPVTPQPSEPDAGHQLLSVLSDQPLVTQSAGGGAPHNNLHPYFAVTYLIYAGQ